MGGTARCRSDARDRSDPDHRRAATRCPAGERRADSRRDIAKNDERQVAALRVPRRAGGGHAPDACVLDRRARLVRNAARTDGLMPVDLQLPVSDPELQTLIASVAARCLNRAPETIEADTPLALLGLDSLGALEVGAALEDALGVAIPPEMMTECLNLRALTAAVQETRAAGTRYGDRARSL